MLLSGVKLVAAGLALLMIGACAEMAAMKGYTGPTLPADRTALIESGPYTHVEKLNGVKVPSRSVVVLPGKHTVEMVPVPDQYRREYIFYSRVTGSITFTAQAGHRYLAYVDFITRPGAAEEPGSGYKWVGYLKDLTTGDKVARTEELPAEVEPLIYQRMPDMHR